MVLYGMYKRQGRKTPDMAYALAEAKNIKIAKRIFKRDFGRRVPIKSYEIKREGRKWSKKYITRQGKKEGYPKCCVDAFTRDTKRGIFPGAERRGYPKGSGYIPCITCSKRLGIKPFSPAKKKKLRAYAKKHGYIMSDMV